MMKKHDIVEHFYIKIKERKLKNRFIRNIIAICILLGIVLLILIFSQFEKKENKNIVEDLMYDDGQQIYIDDYTITLERIVYESRTKQGKLVISVKREGGDMNDEYIIDLSPFSILIESKEKIENIEKIEVFYKNRNSKDIIKNGKLIDCETCVDKGNNQYILVFRDILDLDEIEFLNFNDVKLVEK